MGHPQIIRTPSGEEMVALPRDQYDALLAVAEEVEDAADLATARERFAEWEAAGRQVTPPEVAGYILEGSSILQAFRRYRGWTERELAERVALDPAEVAKLESGAMIETPAMMAAICDALAIEHVWLEPRSPSDLPA